MTQATVVDLTPWVIAIVAIVAVSIVGLWLSGIHLWGRKSAEQQYEMDFQLGRNAADESIRQGGIEALEQLERELSRKLSTTGLNAFDNGVGRSVMLHRAMFDRAGRMAQGGDPK